MNISGIRTYAGFYDYNTIKNNEVQSQQIQEDETVGAEEVLNVTEGEADGQRENIAEDKNPGQDRGAMEFAGRYQPDAAYELKGIDSDIGSLDVEKAISDMKKDQVLQQYQFFVGENPAGNEWEKIRLDENFSL